MKIAIVGSGISGMTAAWLLHAHHDITVFEAGDYVGGHTHTIDVQIDGERHAIDSGFIVFNDRTYPNFLRLMDRLGVASQPAPMSFSVRCDRTGLEYNGTSLNGLFAQRRNLFRPRFLRMLRDILRFNRESLELLADEREDLTVEEYLTTRRYSRSFADQYLLPMGAAIWSCPVETFARFPMRFIVEFYLNHGLLSLRDRPQWRVICGGSKNYVATLTAPFQNRIRLNSPVQNVRRDAEGIVVSVAGQPDERFDHVIFACHSDQALKILGTEATRTERELLSAFPYQPNVAVMHTDESVLPRRRMAWAAWNYHIRRQNDGRSATLTYNMNILQSIRSRHTFCVTLNSEEDIAPEKIIGRWIYHHPVYTAERRRFQQRHAEVINRNHTSFCGAWWGNGFHEDGVNSAIAVCRGLGIHPPW